jgi:hypothetical protein
MKSFDDIANPHLKVNIARKKRYVPSKKPKKIKVAPQPKCKVVPLLVHLFPELIEHSFTINPTSPMTTYRNILLEAGKLRKELLSLV